MAWNFAVVRRTYPAEDEIGTMLEIHSANYDGDDPTYATSISTQPSTAVHETLEELRLDVAKMLEAFGRPILDYADFLPLSANHLFASRRQPAE